MGKLYLNVENIIYLYIFHDIVSHVDKGFDYSQVNEWVFDNEEDAKEKFTFISEYWNEPSLDKYENQYAWIHPLEVLRNPNNPKQTELELNNG